MNSNVSASSIKVWDRFVRLFHWSLVLLFTSAYLTSQTGMQNTHMIIGYVLTGLISARFLWGIIGTSYARFSSFIYSPKQIIDYIKSIFSGHPKRYLGHNPAGGAMVAALLVSLSIMITSGFVIEATIEFEGLLMNLLSGIDDQTAYLWHDVHEITTNIILVLIVLHISGVVLASKQHNENLVSAMITGYKQP